MKHAGCGGKTRVADSRLAKGQWTLRRRQCLKCKARFSTYEIRATSLKRLMEAEKQLSELELPIWAVVNFRGIVKARLKHSEATELVKKFAGQPGYAGICIVTTAAAEKIGNGRKDS